MSHPLLSRIHQVINLTEEEEDFVLSLFSKRKLSKNGFFLEAHQVSDSVGFVEKGLLRYYMIDNGNDITYSFAKENDFVSNYASFLPGEPSDKYIQALEDCVLWQIKKKSLEKFYTTVWEGERFGRLVIENVFVQIINQLTSVYRDDPETRYQNFISEHGDIQQRVPQYIIASFVGVQPQSLSRIRKRLSL